MTGVRGEARSGKVVEIDPDRAVLLRTQVPRALFDALWRQAASEGRPVEDLLREAIVEKLGTAA